MKIVLPTKIFFNGGKIKEEYNPYKMTYAGVKFYDKWDNEKNRCNLTPLWEKLNLPVNNIIECNDFPSYGSHIISLYVTEVDKSKGVKLRPGICRNYWWDDYEVEFIENEENSCLLSLFMEALGLEYKKFPTNEDTVKLAQRLCDLDKDFKSLFEVYFTISEFPDDYESLKEKYSELQDDYFKIKRELEFKNRIINILNKEGDETWHFLLKKLSYEDFQAYRELRKKTTNKWVLCKEISLNEGTVKNL